VSKSGCTALLDAMRGEVCCKQKLVTYGGIDAIVTALKMHREHADLCAYACAAIANLSTIDAVRTRVGQAGAVEAILAALVRCQLTTKLSL
jgi:hypothetical protein